MPIFLLRSRAKCVTQCHTALRKMNWTCNNCGMSAGRKTSVIRHISNPNIHNGDGRAVPLGTYRALAVNRTNQSKSPSRISSIAYDGTGDLRVRIEKEVENLIVKEVAKKIFASLPNNDPTSQGNISTAKIPKGYLERLQNLETE
jgi:hypothetical protein